MCVAAAAAAAITGTGTNTGPNAAAAAAAAATIPEAGTFDGDIREDFLSIHLGGSASS